MSASKEGMDRRQFLRASTLAGGGLLLNFSWLAGRAAEASGWASLPEAFFELNSYIRISPGGSVTLFSANPEFGSNVKTSMPMILAEELDVEWEKVVVEQADLYPQRFSRQFTGGSQGIRQGWKPLRTAGATARRMLVEAAAQQWGVPAQEVVTERGRLHHKATGRSAGYGEMASAASRLPVPKDVKLKDARDFRIIGTSRRNTDLQRILTGKPLFGIDHVVPGMLHAVIVHPPAFGMRLKSFDAASVKSLPGVKDVFSIRIMNDAYVRNFFDTATFLEMVAIVGVTTWPLLQAKRALRVEWEEAPEMRFQMGGGRPGGASTQTVPAGLESTSDHLRLMEAYDRKPGKVLRRDGDPEAAFRSAHRVLERTYRCPFLAHNTMEPVNCFAHVTDDGAVIHGPTQAPEFIVGTIADILGMPKEKVKIGLARMGGGFGLRAYSHHMVEAAVISQQAKAPVKLLYTREDDMTYGIYRPTYMATFRAALDSDNRLLAFHVKAGGIPETPISPNRFPAGAVDNYLAESWEHPSNITIGAFRAPRSNFMASAEQSFLDELAEAMGQDPIAFRLGLLDRAAKNPVGSNNDYDARRYAGVLELVREKSGWKPGDKTRNLGVSAYFCHNSYVAEVVDTRVTAKRLEVRKVYAAVDCGIVVNPDAAANMGEGAIVDGIGNALFGEMPFEKGVPKKSNFSNYRMIRHREAPKSIEVHFVQNGEDPTGLGEPLFPPIFAALANSLYRSTGQRFYEQPFLPQLSKAGVQV
jgi:isoquinoline 1-oxidoreductase beta subunit